MSKAAGAPPVQQRTEENGERRDQRILATIVKGLDREDRIQQLMDLLGSEEAVRRFKAVALHTIASNSDLLLNSDPMSVIEAVRESAAMGLEPTGLLGEGAIIRYKSIAKFQPMYRGLLKLARRSGQIAAIDCQVVYMNDEFDIQYGTDPHILHRPILVGDPVDEDKAVAERGSFRGVYAWARLESDPVPIIEWMTTDDINLIMQMSPSVKLGKASPWDDHWPEMARKTVLKRLMKRLPLSAQAEHAMKVEALLDEEERKRLPALPAGAKAALAHLGLPTGEEASDVQSGSENGEVAEATVDPAAEGEWQAPHPPESDDEPHPDEPIKDVNACGSESPYGDKDTCQLPDGHPGNHRGTDRSSWK